MEAGATLVRPDCHETDKKVLVSGATLSAASLITTEKAKPTDAEIASMPANRCPEIGRMLAARHPPPSTDRMSACRWPMNQ